MPLPILKLPVNPDNCIVRGSTWYGAVFTVTKDGDPVDLTGCEIKITFRAPQETWTIETGGDGITLNDPTAGKFTIDKIQELNVAPVVYNADVDITFPSGDKDTYFGIELTVTDDITK